MKKNGVKEAYLPMPRCFAGSRPTLVVARARAEAVRPRVGSSRRRRQVPDADQVVRRQAEEEHPAHAGPATMARLSQQSDRLEPAEDLLDALAFPLAHAVAGVARGASI